MRRLVAGPLVALALLATGAERGHAQEPGHAQSFAQQVWTFLQQLHDHMDGHGYSVQNYVIGHLAEGSTDSWTLALKADTTYVITSACDTDCSDLDVLLRDGSGTIRQRATDTDDIPLLVFTPASSGRYSVEVRMLGCSAEPCYFGLGVYRK